MRTIHGHLSPSFQHCPPSVPVHPTKLDLGWPSFLPPPSPPLAGGGEGGCLCSGPSPHSSGLSHPGCSLPVFCASAALTPTSLGLQISWKDLLSLFQSVCTTHSVTAPEPCASSCCSLNPLLRLPGSLPVRTCWNAPHLQTQTPRLCAYPLFLGSFSGGRRGLIARRIFVLQPGIEHVSPAVEAWSLNHWTAREFPHSLDRCYLCNHLLFWPLWSLQPLQPLWTLPCPALTLASPRPEG